jgi:hypothetical protein
MISKLFQHFLNKQGPVRDQQHVETEYANSYRGRLPATLIEFWINYGWGSYADGMLKLCDPAMFSGVLERALGMDSIFKPQECLVFAFTAFGELNVWRSDHLAFRINLIGYELYSDSLFNNARKVEEDIEITTPLMTFKKDRNDVRDKSNRPLYDDAVKLLGYPSLDECFGFHPALPLGGERNLKHLKRVKAREHFGILAQMRPLRLMDYQNFPPKFVRDIG